MLNTLQIEQKQKIYEKIDQLFDEVPSYQELVEAFKIECQLSGYTAKATKEIIVDYFLLWQQL